MRSRQDHGRTVEEVLRSARILAHEYDDLDVAASREDITRDRPGPTRAPGRVVGVSMLGRGLDLSRHERAARELGSTDAMVLNS
ncbi:hypothetical protein, partial [Embleya sp. NPDC056538]